MRGGSGGCMLPCMRDTFTVSGTGKRPRRSRALWLEEVKRWRQSGQSAVEYASQRGLHAGTLVSWSSKLRSERSVAAEQGRRGRGAFVPVRVTEPKVTASAAGDSIEVVLCNGRRVLVHGEFGADRLGRLLDIVEGGAGC